MFEKVKTKKIKYKVSELPKKPNLEFNLPALTAGIQNQGLNCYVPKESATVLKNLITISANGANTGATFYQKDEFTVLQDAYAIDYKNKQLTDKQYLFLVGIINNKIYGNYEWTNKAGWEKIKKENIQLPIKNGEIDFDFMEDFIAELSAQRIAELSAQRIAELENYLIVSNLKDYNLTKKEKLSLEMFDNLEWKEYNLEKLFGKATRGKRLKSADRIAGNLPFVTAGETNEGVSAYIGNNVEIFSRNTTTIDMFGSAKYRVYDYGADDHIAVVHTEKLKQNVAIFLTTSIHKSSYTDKFSYSRNFYAKDADELNISLPIKENDNIDFDFMETFISAVKKLVIKGVAIYTDEKIKATERVVNCEEELQ